MRYKLVIVGCGRSGTAATASRIRAAGLDFGHERLRVAGGAGYALARKAWRKGGREYSRDMWLGKTETVLLQVREPWAAISSMMTHGDSLRVKISAELPDKPWAKQDKDNSDCLGLWRAQYWLWWNQHCLSMAHEWYRVEELDTPGSKGRTLLEAAIDRQLPDASNRNSRKHLHLTRDSFRDWPELVAEIDTMAAFFGYGTGIVATCQDARAVVG